MTPICFLDVESDGLAPGRKVWEVALIRRDDTGQRETQFYVDIDLATADPFGLRVGGFYDRHPLGRYLSGLDQRMDFGATRDPHEAAEDIARWTHGATIVGAVPNFDTETLAPLLRAECLTPAWSHRLRCVETLTEGYLRRPVGGLKACAEALGVEQEAAHTALGDARTAMRIWDTVMTNA